MTAEEQIIEKLRDTHRLTAKEYKSLLENAGRQGEFRLQKEAQRTAIASFGRRIYIRGLIEISNYCRNNCYYCGLRAGNAKLQRYRLSAAQIMECCREGYKLGFRTFVLQGGEDMQQNDEWVEKLIMSIRCEFPDCAITLSLGEKSAQTYKRFKAAGADRYLLRHESHNPEHYGKLHPAQMSRDKRLECLDNLKEAGYQTGAGIMVGSPYQTTEHIAQDLEYIQEFKPEMVGIGPFIHNEDTPFASFPDGSVEKTLTLIAILRLMNPHALIPATTALATLDPEARKKAILHGANVVMPNLSPSSERKMYAIYKDKAAFGCEGAEGLEMLNKELETIGYETVVDRGDYIYC